MESDSENNQMIISKWLYENLAIEKIAKGKITYKLLSNVEWPSFILEPLKGKTDGLTWQEIKTAFPFHK